MKRLLSVLLVALMLVICVSCGGSKENTDAEPSVVTPTGTPGEGGTAEQNIHHVEMTFDGFGKIVVELYADNAPITVAHFIDLVKNGLYDGTSIIRVQTGFVIQGGSGTGAKAIKGEFSANGVNNPTPHKRGTLSMARSTAMDSATDQFFICLDDTTAKQLDGNYAAFGAVVEGMNVIDAIVEARSDINCLDLSNLYLAQRGFLNKESYIKILSAKVID